MQLLSETMNDFQDCPCTNLESIAAEDRHGVANMGLCLRPSKYRLKLTCMSLGLELEQLSTESPPHSYRRSHEPYGFLLVLNRCS